MSENNNKKISLKSFIIIIAAILLIVFFIYLIFALKNNDSNDNQDAYKDEVSEEMLDKSVHNALLEEINHYYEGEFSCEVHRVLLTEKSLDNIYKVYLVNMTGIYGFENDTFTKVAGSGVIPMVLTFEEGRKHSLNLLKVDVPLDGSMYKDSVRKLFPKKLHDDVLRAEKYYLEMTYEEEGYAKDYLKSINRKAEVKANVDKDLSNMMVEAKNTIFDIFSNYPYWIGTKEIIEDDVRYVLETKWEGAKDGVLRGGKEGPGTVTFVKYRYDDKKVVEEYVYDVTENNEIINKKAEKEFNYSSDNYLVKEYIKSKIIDAFNKYYDDINVDIKLNATKRKVNENKNNITAYYDLEVARFYKDYKKQDDEIYYLVKHKDDKNYKKLSENYRKVIELKEEVKVEIKIDNIYNKISLRDLYNEDGNDKTALKLSLKKGNKDISFDNYLDSFMDDTNKSSDDYIASLLEFYESIKSSDEE